MKIKGKFIYLKKIVISDANFIYRLRKKKNISLFLHNPPKSLCAQKKWMISNIKNKRNLDFIILSKKNNKKIGTIALNNITKKDAEWGRWISQGNIIENIESVIVLLDFGFKHLNLINLYSLTNKKNKKVVNFHKNTTALNKGTIKSFFLIRNKKIDAIKFSFNKKRFKLFKKKFQIMTGLAQ